MYKNDVAASVRALRGTNRELSDLQRTDSNHELRRHSGSGLVSERRI
jgi:hypothetical protein